MSEKFVLGLTFYNKKKKSTLGHLILIVKEHGPWKEKGNKSQMTFKKIEENIYASTTQC